MRYLYILPALLFLHSMSFGETMPAAAKTYLDDKSNIISEDGLPSDAPQGRAFGRYGVGNWRDVLRDFAQLAPDTRRQSLIVVAEEFLPPQDYVAFVSGICDLKAAGKVTIDTVRMVATAKMLKSDFLAFNYDKPAVTAVIARLEAILQAGEPGKWTAFFAGIKAGTTKQAVVAERTADGEPMPEALEAGPSSAYQQLMAAP